MKSRQSSRSRRRWGFAFATLILLGAVFIGLAGALTSQVTHSLTATQRRMNHSQSRYAAFAGLQHALLLIRFFPEWNQSIPPTTMPGNENVSYTVEVTNNLTDPPVDITLPGGLVVPPGAVYLAAMGMAKDDGSKIELHAMTGILTKGNPTLKHAAFAENEVALTGNALSDSFQYPTTGFTIAGDGRADAPPLNGLGDVGSNRYANLDATSGVHGKLYQPSTSSFSPAAGQVTGGVVTLDNPLEVPVVSPPVDFGAPGPALTDPAPMSSANPATPVVHEKLTLTSGQSMTVGPGRYFFPNGIDIDGALELAANVDEDNPVIFYVGNDAKFGNAARVNVSANAKTRNFQLVMVDLNDGTPQTFEMLGNSQLFGAVLGGKAQGTMSGNASLYGGFLGRSLSCADNTQVIYDETLALEPLDVSMNWGLSGVTEPKPEIVMTTYPALKTTVMAVSSGTETAIAPVSGQKVMSGTSTTTLSPTFNPAVGPSIGTTSYAPSGGGSY